MPRLKRPRRPCRSSPSRNPDRTAHNLSSRTVRHSRGGGHQQHQGPQGHPGQQRRKQQQGKPGSAPTLDLVELKDMSIQNLNQVAKDMGVLNAAGLRKQELIFKILQTQAEKSGLIFSEGVLECLPGRVRIPARSGIQLPAGA